MEQTEQDMIGVMVTEIVELCPWMQQSDVALVEVVVMAHVGRVAWEAVNLAAMAEALRQLAQRAQEAGDRRRAWAFDQWYRWACASMQGQEYSWPELPQELSILP